MGGVDLGEVAYHSWLQTQVNWTSSLSCLESSSEKVFNFSKDDTKHAKLLGLLT